MKTIDIAIVGATGMVGSTVLALLEERGFPVGRLYLLASARSAGEEYDFRGESLLVADVAEFDFSQSTLCFFCASSKVAAQYIPIAIAKGNRVIDKSAHFRYDDNIPLVIPEVNGDALLKTSQLIAVPNCSTIPIAMVLKPIYDAVGITRVNIATYQSVSGTGKEGVSELAEQTAQLLNGSPIKKKVYAQQIAFNVLPHIDDFEENGYTREEMKVVRELQKIFSDVNLKINPTAVRVPVFYGHSAAVHIETREKCSAKDAIRLLRKMPGVEVITGKHPYPTPVQDAAGEDSVYVGRVRDDISCDNGLNLWVVCDNVRKGAALNGVQIAEAMLAFI